MLKGLSTTASSRWRKRSLGRKARCPKQLRRRERTREKRKRLPACSAEVYSVTMVWWLKTINSRVAVKPSPCTHPMRITWIHGATHKQPS
jgi:hypothetical protein